MFDKFAEEAKEAEVRGVLAAFVDSGLMKIASRDDFDVLSDVVSENLGDTYTIDDIADVTGAVLDGELDKTAEDDEYAYDEDMYDGEYDDYSDVSPEDAYDVATDIGSAYIMKTAGEIDDEDFEDYADDLIVKTASLGSSLGRLGRRLTGRQTLADSAYGYAKSARKAVRGAAKSARGYANRARKSVSRAASSAGTSLGRLGRRLSGRETVMDHLRGIASRTGSALNFPKRIRNARRMAALKAGAKTVGRYGLAAGAGAVGGAAGYHAYRKHNK